MSCMYTTVFLVFDIQMFDVPEGILLIYRGNRWMTFKFVREGGKSP